MGGGPAPFEGRVEACLACTEAARAHAGCAARSAHAQLTRTPCDNAQNAILLAGPINRMGLLTLPELYGRKYGKLVVRGAAGACGVGAGGAPHSGGDCT